MLRTFDVSHPELIMLHLPGQ